MGLLLDVPTLNLLNLIEERLKSIGLHNPALRPGEHTILRQVKV